jgi:hypothetical protein
MKDPEICHVEYCGFLKPSSPDEIEFEILGLETAISEARKRINILKQSSLLAKIQIMEIDKNDNHPGKAK